ncbi:MAG: CoA-substrate-specific enzyme activase [Lachnospiraceae bacterium]|nr:CoA-substrate-specific enzyme activase [Lachnospiraceae bacterium]
MDRIQALLAGKKRLYPEVGSIVEMGAQSSVFLTGLKPGEQLAYAVNGECAAGTGSFFEDQMYRLGLPIDSYSDYVRRAKTIPRLAGRCSVFAKTDLIHRQQEGVSSEDILLGLAYAVVRNFKATVVRKMEIHKPLLLAGGVVKNEGVKRALLDIFSLKEEELVCEDEGSILSAVGMALLGLERKIAFRPESIDSGQKLTAAQEGRLVEMDYDKDELHRTRPLISGEKLWLGVDVGSTSTNLVLIGEDGKVIDYQYLRTAGDPAGAVEKGLAFWKEKYKEDFVLEGKAVTGSGRYYIAKLLDTTNVLDEITAQARAAAYQCPEVDTVFEIGGQDSKFIRIADGQVVDFEMNKICAAGTGSFIEEQASRIGLSLSQIGEQALLSEKRLELGERCTVLMESRIGTELAGGSRKTDICAGLCRAIVGNYLNRVVNHKKVGEVICLQGGVMHNKGIVAAFYERYGSRIHLSSFYDVTGAYGAALEARRAEDKLENKEAENHRLYEQNRQWFLAGYDGKLKEGRATVGIPRALMIYKFFPMAYKFFTGLGYNVLLSPESDEEIIGLAQETTVEETCYPIKLMHGHMEWLARQGVDYVFVPSVRTIKHETSRVEHNYGCVYMQTAPGFIAKLLNYEQRGITLLSPLLNMDMGKPQLAQSMLEIGAKLGKNKAVCGIHMAAGAAAMKACEKQTEKLGKEVLASLQREDKVLVLITRNYGISDRVLNMGIPGELLKRGCRVLTLSHLEAHDLDISREYPNVYWPFGQHILSGVHLIKNHPNLYAVYLTNHGCGPDTMLSHLVKEVMGDKPYLSIEVDEHQSAVGVVTRIEAFLNSLKYTENKMTAGGQSGVDLPELDSGKVLSKAAFGKNSSDPAAGKIVPGLVSRAVIKLEELDKEKPIYLPYLSVYTELLAAWLRKQGIQAEVLPDYSRKDMLAGKSENTSKEYSTFSAVLGRVFTLAEEKQDEFSFLLPQTEGAEAEGVVSRVTESILRKKQLDQVSLFGPFIEQLPEELWRLIVLGDAWLYLPQALRDKTDMRKLAQQAVTLNWPEVMALVREWREQVVFEKTIPVFGSPLLVYSANLNRNLESRIREKGYQFLPMSLAEYLWFWMKDAGKTVPKEVNVRLGEFLALYREGIGLSESGNEAADSQEADSPSVDLEETYARIDRSFPKITGGNVRFLSWQLIRQAGTARGKILITPCYSNSASIIELTREKPSLPFLHFQLDGNEEKEELERLEIFLNLLD